MTTDEILHSNLTDVYAIRREDMDIIVKIEQYQYERLLDYKYFRMILCLVIH